MIKVIIPKYFEAELKYTLNVLLEEFLGLSISFECKEESKSVSIELSNYKTLELPTYFFDRFKNDEDYLNAKNIPGATFDIDLFGQKIRSFEKVQESVKSDKGITLGVDILGPTFFMLSRWEEYVSKVRDKHDRFPGVESLAQKEGFHQRPIVNEYVELLWSCLLELGIQDKRKAKKYEAVLTCDVDYIQKYYRPINLIRGLGGDVIIRKNPFLWFRTIVDFMKSKISIKKDPFYTFDYLMDSAENIGVKFHFYFMPLLLNEYDARYNISDAEDIIKSILERGHIVGMHPGYDSYNNANRFNEETKRLKTIYPEARYGRQHYLRIKSPMTHSYWENNGFKYDSTYGYENDIGFRCGVCYEFPIFDFIRRKDLTIRELPLSFMEVAYFEKFGDKLASISREVIEMQEKIKFYSGMFVVLWHNNNLKKGNFKSGVKIFEDLIELADQNKSKL